MPYWKQTQTGVTHNEKSVHVNNRMTEYEANRFRLKADKLLSVCDKPMCKHTINRFVAYGKHRLIGVFMQIGNDPLDNGIITENFKNFSVNAVNVKGCSHGEVFIRFKYNGEIDV